jgi:SWI/SNF-related matrix-associated actin-dependent regulator 1 of chromatin subfamily A
MEDIKNAGFIAAAFDEAHFCKKVNNHGKPDSKRAKFFMRIVNQIEFVFILTGTPISNRTRDIFNLLKAIKHPLSKDFKSFAQKYCAPEFNGYGWSYDGSSNQEELNDQLQGFMLRRLKRDMLDLPEKTRSFIPVEVNKSQYFKDMNKYMDAKTHFTNKGQHLMLLNAMRHNLAKEKSKALIKMIENLLDQNKPVVVFTNFTYVVNAVKNKFKEAVTITGEDNAEDRGNAIESFQSGKTNLIVCNLIAGGTGVTLTRAKNMLINEFDWIPGTILQAEDRIHRIGQSKDVVIEYLYSEGTFDEKMALLLEEKLKNINKIIDGSDEGFLDEVINWLN